MNILARHLSVDLYGCKLGSLTTAQELKEWCAEMLSEMNLPACDIMVQEVDEEHYALMVLLAGGHFALHVYTKLGYVAGDVFLCNEGADPEPIFKAVRKLFSPEKTKTTFLKRGDFGTVPDMKPKIRTRVAPLRKIHNTGAKVIRVLARRRK